VRPPFIPLPRALADKDGNPHKGVKSTVTNFFMKRYAQSEVILTALPKLWVPDTVLLEGMFMIQSSPLSKTYNFHQYCLFLLSRYVLPHLYADPKEIHIIFDNANQEMESPKVIEQARRDKLNNTSNAHKCLIITDDVKVPSNWRCDMLNCRCCKRNLCEYLCHKILQEVHHSLRNGQKVCTAGGFQGDTSINAYQFLQM
jgi:hypothetical protein